MINSLALVGQQLGQRWYDQSFILKSNNGVKTLEYPLVPLNTVFDNDQNFRGVAAITFINPEGKGTDTNGVSFVSAATLAKGFVYLKGVDQRDIWPMMPIEQLIPDTNRPYIFLDAEQLGKINWNQSKIVWGSQDDIADDDISKAAWMHIVYASFPQNAAGNTTIDLLQQFSQFLMDQAQNLQNQRR